jgi:hypothetical protein
VSELRVAVAGCLFVITPAELLTSEERRALRRLAGDHVEGRDFTLRITDTAPPKTKDAPRDGEPAAITTDGSRILVVHERFAGWIDPQSYEAEVFRGETTEAFAIEIVLRTALGCRLPQESGVLLHSAGIVIDGSAYVFYGISGAGKSTLAGFMKNVLSDELVALRHDANGFTARATGFWGTLDSAEAPAGAYPLRAAIELSRGDGVSLETLSVAEARRKLLLVAVVPPQQELWTATLRVIDDLARVTAFQLAWTPSEENATRVIEMLRGGRSGRPHT